MNLQIVPIGNNPRILPAGECIGVQSADDASALRSLQQIAARRRVQLCEKVYRWGQGTMPRSSRSPYEHQNHSSTL